MDRAEFSKEGSICLMTSSRRLFWVLALNAASATFPIELLAQNASSGAEVSGSDQLSEILVTAEKRESTVQKTPISITAISGSQLETLGLTDENSALKEVPGVSMRTQGPGQTEFEMRGLNSGGGQSPTVGFYIDETPVSPFANASGGKFVIDPDLYDLNRMEVLRGPQGTLYGAGSMGGTVRLITNLPDTTAFHASGEASGSGTYHGGGNEAENVMLNVPLIQDQLALRIVQSYKHDDGFIDRVVLSDFPLPTNGGLTRGAVEDSPVETTHHGANTLDLNGARATLLWTPNDSLTVQPLFMFQHLSTGGESTIDNPPGNRLVNYQPFDVNEPSYDDFRIGSLLVGYDLSHAVKLTSTTSYWTRNQMKIEDGSEELQDVLELTEGVPLGFTPQTGGIGANAWQEYDQSKQFSSEFRATSEGDAPLQWTVGGFYGHFESIFTQNANAFGGAAALGTTHLLYIYNPLHLSQEAAFADLTYAVTPSFKANVAVRYYHYSSQFDTVSNGFFGPNGAGGPDATSHATQDSSGANPKLDLSYQPSANLTVYGTISKGFRPGGGNFQIAVEGNPEADACRAALNALGRSSAPLTYQSDSLWNYEVGEKARLLDDKLSVNVSVYHDDWRHVQRNIVLSCGYFYTDNAGRVNSNGAELEVAAAVTSGLQFTEALDYSHSVYADNSLEAGVTKGQFLPSVPQWTSATRIFYTQQLGNNMKLVATVTNNYTDSTNDVLTAFNRLPPYDVVGARVGVGPDKWRATLFVDNLTNKLALLTDINPVSLSVPTFNRVAVNQPRTIGIDLSFNY